MSFLFVSCKSSVNEEDADMTAIPIEQTERVSFKETQQLIQYVDAPSNGYIKEKQINNISYSSVLKPLHYLLAKRKTEDNRPDYKLSDFEDLQYFDIRIRVNDFNQEFIKYDLQSPQQFEERVKYCAFDMQNDITLIDGKDTLACVLFHFERTFNTTPFGHFILGFPTVKKKNIEAKTICFNDRLFNNGLIKFTYSPRIISKEPILL